ncbi:hypothetical protein ES703_30445 [subsurface metagenome]
MYFVDTIQLFDFFLNPVDSLKVLFVQERIILLDKHRDSFTNLIFFIQPVIFLCPGISLGKKAQKIRIKFEAKEGSQGNNVQNDYQNNN